MLRILSLFLCLLLANTASARCAGTDLRTGLSPAERTQLDRMQAGAPFEQGNHWIARRGARTIHVIGTMHLNDPRWPPIVERLRPVIARAGRVLVEMSPQDQAQLEHAVQTQPDLLFRTDGPTLPELLPEDSWQTLSAALIERGIPPMVGSRMQPWFLSVMLGVPGCALTAGDKSNGLDRRLIALAEGYHRPVQSLEPYDTLFRLFGQETLETQLRYLLLNLSAAANSEDQFATMTNAYFDERPLEAWMMALLIARRDMALPRAEINAAFAELEQRLITDRNASWMPAILTAPEQTLVVAVGAMHLPGPNGVLALLDKAGFEVQRAAF